MHGALEYAKKNLKEDDVMVIIMPDHGTRYLGKVYNDNWMKDHGYTESGTFATARDIVATRSESDVFTIDQKSLIGEAIKVMNEKSIDQAPVVDGDQFVGSISDAKILKALIENPALKSKTIAEIMDPSFKFIALDSTVDVMSKLLNKENKALLVTDTNNKVQIITQTDLLVSLTK